MKKFETRLVDKPPVRKLCVEASSDEMRPDLFGRNTLDDGALPLQPHEVCSSVAGTGGFQILTDLPAVSHTHDSGLIDGIDDSWLWAGPKDVQPIRGLPSQ